MPRKSKGEGAINERKTTSPTHNAGLASGLAISSNGKEKLADGDKVLISKYAYVPALEPAATAIAMKESPEGENLYQEIKQMEFESQLDPDPEDERLEMAAADDFPELPADDSLGTISHLTVTPGNEANGEHLDAALARISKPERNGKAHYQAEDLEIDEDPLTDLDRLAHEDPGFVTDPVRLYLREISHAPLLKSDQELELAHQIAKWRR